MRYRIDYYLRSLTQADAQTVSNRVQQDLASRTDFAVDHGPSIYQDGDTHLQWVASGGGWFTTEAGSRQVQSTVSQRMTSGPIAGRILPGSVVELHPCNNEDVTACDPATVERTVK